MQFQRFGFALPLAAVATPLTYIVLMAMCFTWNNDSCAYTATMPGYLFFRYKIFMKSMKSAEMHIYIYISNIYSNIAATLT
jgi:hypothetical protein